MVSNVKSAVVIAQWPGYGMADPGLEIRQGHDNFLFSKMSRGARAYPASFK